MIFKKTKTKNPSLKQDILNDALIGSDIVEKRLKYKLYSHSDVVNDIHNCTHLLTKNQQALLLQNYSYDSNGKFDWRIPSILAYSMNTCDTILKMLGNESIWFYAGNKSILSYVDVSELYDLIPDDSFSDDFIDKMDGRVQDMAKKTLSYRTSYIIDKNSILHYLDEKIKDSEKMFYGDDVVPNVSDYNKNAYRDMRELLFDSACKAPIRDKITDFLNQYDDIYNTNEKILNELLEVCDEFGETRSLGLKHVLETIKEKAIELGHIESDREEITYD